MSIRDELTVAGRSIIIILLDAGLYYFLLYFIKIDVSIPAEAFILFLLINVLGLFVYGVAGWKSYAFQCLPTNYISQQRLLWRYSVDVIIILSMLGFYGCIPPLFRAPYFIIFALVYVLIIYRSGKLYSSIFDGRVKRACALRMCCNNFHCLLASLLVLYYQYLVAK